jgi:hypothetical protein
MDSITFELLANKLKNAPQSVLESVSANVDRIIKPDLFLKILSKEQQQVSDNQIHFDKSTYIKAETLFQFIKVSRYSMQSIPRLRLDASAPVSSDCNATFK